ncbi:hypothetical protein PYJP_12150 [Pyrofollis japonicus]|uniref:hypothetical protein n=1 Tax=Pyrofollis japonicus TaxID=3060460 RepID=UPI00295AEE18|nr:hypothetical protein [Pyrofollis japonicus]BEP17863.1 hypothetical protein PYJP_12150 [Pyrofollis japonicus]
MALLMAARREEHVVGKYKITILYDDQGRAIGAFIEGGRLARPLYIAAKEPASVKLPKPVLRFLAKHGFNVKA